MGMLDTEGIAPAITRLAERAVFASRFAQVFNDDVEFPDGSRGQYVRVIPGAGKGKGAGVVILPVAAGLIGLVCVYRYPVQTWEWALPRGHAEHDDPAESARAELLEEMNMRPDRLTHLGETTPDTGILDVTVNMFLAESAEPGQGTLDPGEIARTAWVPVPVLLRAIADGQVRDGFTLSAVCLALVRGLLR